MEAIWLRVNYKATDRGSNQAFGERCNRNRFTDECTTNDELKAIDAAYPGSN